MNVVNIKIEDINPSKYNPRKITDEELSGLRESLKKFGFVEPLIINKRSGNLVGGHMRTKAAELEGYTEIPVTYVDLSDVEEKALNVALNSPAIQGKFDNEILKELLEEIKEVDSESFDDLRFDVLSDDLNLDFEPEIIEGLTDDDTVPEVKESIVKRGDIWKLGNHRLLCGDSTIIDDVEKLMDGQKADMVFTDPPYGMNAVSKSGVLSKNYSGDILNDDTTDVAKDCYNLCESLGISKMVFWGANYYSSCLPDATCWLVWDKNNGQSDQMDCELAWTNFKGCTRQFTQASEKTNRVHPTQKPVSLAEWCFKRWEAGDVLDLFLGSGSTLIACEKTNRKCYGMELDSQYCDIIIKRWEDYTGNKAELLNDNG